MTATEATAGTGTPSLFPAPTAPTTDTLVIEGDCVIARSPEGAEARLPVEKFVALLNDRGPDSGSVVLPDGVRCVRSQGNLTVLVWEHAPKVHHVRWIAKDSPLPFRRAPVPGAGDQEVKYEDRRLAMPYLVVFAVFVRRRGRLVLTGANEAFFRTRPFTSGADELCLPALLNISRYPEEVAPSQALAWICTQYLDLGHLERTADENERVRASLDGLRHTLLGTAFNRSSEHHELESCYTLCARTMPQIADLDEWERLSREDPLWVLDAEWPRAEENGKPVTVDGLIERIFRLRGGGTGRGRGRRTHAPRDAADLARMVLSRPGATKTGSKKTTKTAEESKESAA